MELSGMIYQCSAGETFDSVALEVYGDSNFAADLLSANPSHCRKGVFNGGEELELPVVEVAEEGSSEDYTASNAPWKEV